MFKRRLRSCVINDDALNVLPTLPDDSVAAVVSDPPYGMRMRATSMRTKSTLPKIANDERPFIWWLGQAFRVTRPGGALLCFCRWDCQDVFRNAAATAGYKLKSQIIWDRVWHGTGDCAGQFAPQHEVVWFATKGRCLLRGKRPRSVLRVRKVDPRKLRHLAEKPVELLRRLVAAVTDPGDVVLDPLCGVGSTGVAALQLRRRFIGIELDPAHAATARRRLRSTAPNSQGEC